MTMLFDPATLPPRDQDGYTWHPDLDERFQHDEFDEYLDSAKLLALSLEQTTVEFEFDAPEELRARYFDEGEGCPDWQPTSPGNDWRVAAIYDSEEGPVALFVRDIAQGGAQ